MDHAVIVAISPKGAFLLQETLDNGRCTLKTILVFGFHLRPCLDQLRLLDKSGCNTGLECLLARELNPKNCNLPFGMSQPHNVVRDVSGEAATHSQEEATQRKCSWQHGSWTNK